MNRVGFDNLTKKVVKMNENLQHWILAAAVLALLIAVIGSANAANANCPACKDGEWSGQDKLDEIGSGGVVHIQSDGLNMPQKSRLNEWNKPDSSAADKDDSAAAEQAPSRDILVTPSEVTSSDTILNVDSNAERYIEGAVHIDYRKFSDESNRPRSRSELSKILGDAGISRREPIVVYSEDPYAATYVYLILDYLGQDRVKLLDGGIEGWTAAGKSTVDAPEVRSKAKYTPVPKSDLIASYSYVKGEDIQVVDARPSKEYATGSLPGSKNVPYDKILNGGKIKEEPALKDLFAGLSKDKPVAVYSNAEAKASLVWYALELEGFNSRLYAGDSWSINLLRNDRAPGTGTSQAKPAPAPASSANPFSPSSSSGSGGAPKCH